MPLPWKTLNSPSFSIHLFLYDLLVLAGRGGDKDKLSKNTTEAFFRGSSKLCCLRAAPLFSMICSLVRAVAVIKRCGPRRGGKQRKIIEKYYRGFLEGGGGIASCIAYEEHRDMI